MKKWKNIIIVSLLLLSIISLNAFAAQNDSKMTFLGTNGKAVKIKHIETVKVSDTKLKEFHNNAKNAIEEEKSKKKKSLNSGTQNITYNYIGVDEKVSYFYEESATSEPELIVYDSENQTSQLLTGDSLTAMATSSGFISDGVGGKQKVTLTGAAGSYLSTQMTLPTSTQVSSDLTKYGPYNYGGFEYNAPGSVGSWASDLGLQLYDNLTINGNAWGWKPIFILKQYGSSGWVTYASVFPNPSYMEGQFRNGYKPGSSPIMYFHYNYNGKVRMKIEGITICPTREGLILQDTNNITIMESSASWNISKIDNWKLLSTVVSPDNTGKNRAVYSAVKVDGVAVPSTNFPTPENDQSSVTRNSNTVTIVVDSSIY